MPPTTALKPAHIAWSHRARQNRFSHAAVPAHDPAAQRIKAWHINANTFVQLLGPSPLDLPPAAAAGMGAALAQTCVPRLWPKAALGSKIAVSWLGAAPWRHVRAGVALQSVLIDLGLRAVAGRWHETAQDISVPPTCGQQLAQRGLLVLPEWALEWAAARAAGWGLHAAGAGLLSAAALCPKLAIGLRLLADVHRALCALPLALGALVLGLTVDVWLIAWRSFQGTAASTESYLFAPCAPPERPRGCWRKPEAGPPDASPQVQKDAAAEAARSRANLLRSQVHTFLNLEPLLQSDPQLRGLFFDHVQVPAYIEQTEALLLQADTPGRRHLFLDSVNFARNEGPKVEALAERWLAAPKDFEHTLPVSGEANAEFRNRHLWTLKEALGLTGPKASRLPWLPWLSAELLGAVHPKDFQRRIAGSYEVGVVRQQQLVRYQADMTALMPDLAECWHISTLEGAAAVKRLFVLLQKDDAFFARLTLCAAELDRQLHGDKASTRNDLDRQGLERSCSFWMQLSVDMDLKNKPLQLQRLLHEDKLEHKRGVLAQRPPGQTFSDETFARLKMNANTLFILLTRLHKAAKAGHELTAKLAPLRRTTQR